MAVYKANALVLRRIPLGETDKILTLFTREYGKLASIAKGSRRTTSRLSGASEPLMLLRALLAEGMNLDVLTQCEVRESFPLVRGDFGLFLRATYCCELLDRLTTDRDPAPDAFDLIISTLYVLQRAVEPDAAVHAFEMRLMAQVGYEPRLDECARCERPLREDLPSGGYSAVRGGVLCADCAAQAREDVLAFGPDALAMLSRLAREDDARALARVEIAPLVREQIARALRAHLRYRLERDIKSTAFLDAFRIGAMDDFSSAPAAAVAAGT